MSKILVVEDFEDARFSLCRLLELAGFQVVEAADGAEAIETAALEKPDLIVMDLTLPKINGIEAVRRIRAGRSKVPIIATTGYDEDEVVDEAMAAGCNAYITKPVDFAALESAISGLLRQLS